MKSLRNLARIAGIWKPYIDILKYSPGISDWTDIGQIYASSHPLPTHKPRRGICVAPLLLHIASSNSKIYESVPTHGVSCGLLIILPRYKDKYCLHARVRCERVPTASFVCTFSSDLGRSHVSLRHHAAAVGDVRTTLGPGLVCAKP